ncbi:Ohr family peroxiredoxin [Deinococcus sp.]|uniref:Ohr family peroxiredoxin n=1 Tax=Deinococcus sp. TaxID=47478 RepID=UPI0025C69919|nr:Ohr family peroxiredoxin [Deinococcus sp.]
MTQTEQPQTEMKKLFTTSSIATGGRNGDVYLGEQRLHLQTRPAHSEREGTDPEEMFGAGYAACFLSALGEVGRRQSVNTSAAQAKAFVSLYAKTETQYVLGVELHVYIPEQTAEKTHELLEIAHQVCPYSNATRGNIEVKLVAETAPLL